MRSILLATLLFVTISASFPSVAYAYTQEEIAVQNFNINVPNEIKDTVVQEQDDLLKKLGKTSQEIFKKIRGLFIKPAVEPAKAYIGSQNIYQSSSFPGLATDGPPDKQLEEFLGTPYGYYCRDLPKVDGVEASVSECETRFERANLPIEVTAVTGQ